MKKILKIILICLLPAGAALLLCASLIPGFAEGYALNVYPWWSRAVNSVTSLAPFSLAEFMAYAAVLVALFFLIRLVVRLLRGRERRGPLLKRFGVNLLCAAGVVFFLYAANCGVNYNRLTFAQVSGLQVRESSKEELIELCDSLLNDVNTQRALVEEDENGVMTSGFLTEQGLADAVRAAYDKLQAEYPTLHSGYGPAKVVLASRPMSYLNITGIYFPFTFEANVNVDIPDHSVPSTMGHELSHLRGYMREDEANFLGYLCCRESGRPELQYSGSILAFVQATNQLYAQDQAAAQAIFDRMSDGVRRDLAADSAYWKQFEGQIAEISMNINNGYLKINSQEDGVKSYGRMVDLMLADYRKTHGG